MRGRLRSALVIVALAGSATQAQRQAQSINASWQSAAAQLQTCVTAVYTSVDAEPIRRHAPLKTTDAALQQLTDPAKATNEEIAAIYLIHPRNHECVAAALDALSATTPILHDATAATFQAL